jgi:flagellin-like protein
MTFMKRKAVSPVIATVVLVAVAITIAVAVSYWMSGISSQYTQFEKVEVTGAYCKSATGNWGSGAEDSWNITLDFRNTGTTEATIIGCSVNSMAIADYGCGTEFTQDNMRAYGDDYSTQLNFAEVAGHDTAPIKYTVQSGANGKLLLSIRQAPAGTPTPYSFSSGTTIEVSLRSGAGNTYMKMITLS